MMIIRDKIGVEWKIVAASMFLLVLMLASLALHRLWLFLRRSSPAIIRVTLQHGGRERSAIVHVPRRAAERQVLPVVVNFHGGGGHGANQKEYSLLDAVAESENFITVYPNGTGRLSGRLLTWNAGTCCAYSVINKIDDVGFVRALIDKLAEKFPIDRRRIYATGMSNGGMMAHRLAAEASDVIAAVAPVAGGMVLPVDQIGTRRAGDAYSQRRRSARALHWRPRAAVPIDQEPSVSSQHRRDDQALGRS